MCISFGAIMQALELHWLKVSQIQSMIQSNAD